MKAPQNLEAAARLVIDLASHHAPLSASAAVGLMDARHLIERGHYGLALGRAITSLAHSVGVFHRDHAAAVEIARRFRSPHGLLPA
jgi:hypothetical protein